MLTKPVLQAAGTWRESPRQAETAEVHCPASRNRPRGWHGLHRGERAGAMTRRSPQDHPRAPGGPGESTKPSNKRGSTSIESSIFSNIIKGHAKTSLSMQQVQNHVRPALLDAFHPSAAHCVVPFSSALQLFCKIDCKIAEALFSSDMLLLQNGHLLRKRIWDLGTGGR